MSYVDIFFHYFVEIILKPISDGGIIRIVLGYDVNSNVEVFGKKYFFNWK